MKELSEPPEGYHSVKGAKATEEEDSFFKVTFAADTIFWYYTPPLVYVYVCVWVWVAILQEMRVSTIWLTYI